MRKYTFWAIAAMILAFAACGDKKVKHEFEELNINDTSQRDSTIYGICLEGSSMHTLQMVTDNGDTLTLSTLIAEDAKQLLGGYSIGDHMAVITNKERTQATLIIHLSTLLGEWVLPNPMDGSSEMGFSIRDGGIAESINQSAIIYETWRITNGDLVLMSVRDGGGNFEESERYKLLYLTADSLAYSNAEETFEFTRPHPEEDYSNLGVELDDDAEEDMIM
jgi:hypothetical protein